MAKKKNDLIYKDFLALYERDTKKKQVKITRSLELSFEKLIKKDIEYSKSRIAKTRNKISSLKAKKQKIVIGRKSKKQVVNKRADLDYTSFQKDFMLAKPIKMTEKLLSESAFFVLLDNHFRDDVRKYFNEEKNFNEKTYTLATIGYHFYFFRGKSKTYQSGFRKPRILLTRKNADKVIDELFKQTFERFDVYFKTKAQSGLMFEGLTAEISFDNKAKRKIK